MQIVIEIPNEVYFHAIDVENRFLTPSEEIVLRDSIVNGTPLPKGHGDLKDADRLLDSFFYEYCRYGDFGYRQAEDLIKSSLTIIEAADKSEV